MKSKIFTLIFICTTAFSINAIGQKKVSNSMNALLQSEFMNQFREIRLSTIASATTIKLQQDKYSVEDQKRVEVAYGEIAARFNSVLLDIKTDLLDRKKLKYIMTYPEDYQKELELDMYKLKDLYATNYQQVLAEVTNDEVDGIGILAINSLVNSSIMMFSLVKGIMNYVSYRKQVNRHLSEKQLQKNFIEPHQFPKWNELEGTDNSGYNNGNSGYNVESQMPQAPQDNLNFTYNAPNEKSADELDRLDERNRKKKDFDLDGVPNDKDKCPYDKGSPLTNGCPDSDFDGFSDDIDKCPNISGEANGCPDSDGDGVADIEDNCRNQFGPISNGGCPVAGSDFGNSSSSANDRNQESGKSLTIPVPTKKKKKANNH